MQYTKLGDIELSRIGLGTKRLPQTDVTHVVRVNKPAMRDIVHSAREMGINYVETSYSAGKGEVEAELGDDFVESGSRMHVSTGFFDMVDPRFDYVFCKQLKKLQTDCIDLYYLEGLNDFVRDGIIDSGVIDYLFEQKEAGRIAKLGFSSELSGENLKTMMAAYPWDFVRLRINFFDWFQKNAREQYEVAAEAGMPILAHGALRTGPAPSLKPDARSVLEAAAPGRSQAEWCLRFVKTLEAVNAVAVNVKTAEELAEDAAVFADDKGLCADEESLLAEAAKLQHVVKRVS